MKILRANIGLFLFCMVSISSFCKAPKLGVVIVIDQFAHSYLRKVESHLTGGLKFLLDNGVVYDRAIHPHAAPSTSTGHTALSTGCFAKDHGIIGNKWYENGQKLRCYKTDSRDEAVFAPFGVYEHGGSARRLMVDGLSDQFVRASACSAKNQVFGISLKRRASIGMANKLGKAIWFDTKAMQFTTSRAYFDQMPRWLEEFNKKNKVSVVPPWILKHGSNLIPYAKARPDRYEFAGYEFSLIGAGARSKKLDSADEIFTRTPAANALVLKLARTCLDTHLKADASGKMLLWVSLSPLDPLGHMYGPDSKEVLDMIYHLDEQLNDFIKFVQSKVKSKEDLLLALTADHGVMPIVEHMRADGYTNAHRLSAERLIKNMNQLLSNVFGVRGLVAKFQSPQFFFDKNVWNTVSEKEKAAIVISLKNYLKTVPGIQMVWAERELVNMCCDDGSIDWYFKNQFFPGRSGDLTCRCFPYTIIIDKPKGTSHKTPYDYDTHVPLVLYQEGSIEKKRVHEKVWMLQFANTIAKIFDVPGPSASTFDCLPGV